jgi:hypothetical protein
LSEQIIVDDKNHYFRRDTDLEDDVDELENDIDRAADDAMDRRIRMHKKFVI